jgi:hypothetical protein
LLATSCSINIASKLTLSSFLLNIFNAKNLTKSILSYQ